MENCVDLCVNSIPGGEDRGQKVAAAAYLKNFTRRNVDCENPNSKSNVSKEFKDQLLRALLQAEQSVVKILVEVVCIFRSSIS